jgi:hypothetical protein
VQRDTVLEEPRGLLATHACLASSKVLLKPGTYLESRIKIKDVAKEE